MAERAAAPSDVRSALVVAEIVASVVLLVLAGLLVQALMKVQAIDPGFRSENVLTLKTMLPRPKYANTVRRMQFYEQVIADTRALPGVRSRGVCQLHRHSRCAAACGRC